MTEKIYASHCASGKARAGEIVTIQPDVILVNDTSGPITIDQLAEMGVAQVHDPARVVLVADHFSPAKDIRTAQANLRLREFGRAQGVKHNYDSLSGGIEHALLPEIGMVGPGGIVFGSDSHTCTAGAFNASGMGFGSTDLSAVLALGELWVKVPSAIRIDLEGAPARFVTGKDVILGIIAELGSDGALNAALEFGGSGLKHLGLDERAAIANMAVEAGAETCIFECDHKVLEYVACSGWTQREPVHPDADAIYLFRKTVRLDLLQPTVAKPPSPANGVPLSSIGDVSVQQVYIGNCSNGTITDLRQAASLLEKHRVHPNVRLLVVPSTNAIYRQAAAEGLLEVFAKAGAAVSMPTCGACFGGHMGILAAGETAVATTNRNFRGRMGHPDSQIYLANAWVAAAAAIAGKITDPSTLI
ncbi:MAG: aconitase/3-isopropylmalate dehydratase large subunit family protein [Pusillimonas sp.]